MSTWTEDLAVLIVDLATNPVVLILAALVLVIVLSGLAGRALLYVEGLTNGNGTRL